MKRTLSVLAVSLAAATSLLAQSSVWKVTKDGHSLYLGGTCHMLRPADLPIPAEFDTAFAAASTIVFETDMARLQSPEAQQLLLTKAAFTDGTTLEKALTPEAWKAVQDYCGKVGLPADKIQSLKPWMIMVTIVAVEIQRLGFTPNGVDRQFHQKAQAAGKKLEGLETLEEQVSFITTMGAGQESDLIIATLRDLARIPGMLDDLLAAWRAGDLVKLDAVMSAEMRKTYPKIFEELFTKRNRAWLPKIEALLASEPTEFVLVGVGHLAGDDGIIHTLKQHGCTVEQVSKAP